MGRTRAERAIDARMKAEEWAKKAALIEAKEKEVARKADTARKVVVGAALVAAIRDGRLTRVFWEKLIAPSLSPRDAQRLGDWPTWGGNNEA